jgi:hypothetical protein
MESNNPERGESVMGEHKLPRLAPAPAPDEVFQINDPEVGKVFAVRALTDAQLEHYHAKAAGDNKQMTMQAMQCLGIATKAAEMAAILAFEKDRRKRSIVIATDLRSI